jgi:hypothetical protein
MTTSRAACVGVVLMLCATGGALLSGQSPTDLTGTWTLNRQLSQFPQEVGFSASFLPPAPRGASSGGSRGGRRGGRNGGGGGAGDGAGVLLPRIPETEDDARRVRFLTDEVRLPPDHLTIAVTPATATITPDRGPARTVQPGKRDEELKLGPVMAIANASWDGAHLVIVYTAETGRLLRYTYAVTQNPRQLIVDVEFGEKGGGGDQVRRIYEPTQPGEAAAAPSSSARGDGPAPAAPLLLPPGAGGSGGSRPASSPPSAASAPAAAVDQRPDASLMGLTRLGVVVEGVDAQAAKCGLKEEPLEAAVTKRLTDAGFRVVRFSDDETYLYVNVNTVTVSAALCVSRYDVTLYSHTAAQLAHTTSPVPLQVELLHKGGLAGGSPTAHADSLMKSVLENVDQFATRLKNANR